MVELRPEAKEEMYEVERIVRHQQAGRKASHIT